MIMTEEKCNCGKKPFIIEKFKAIKKKEE